MQLSTQKLITNQILAGCYAVLQVFSNKCVTILSLGFHMQSLPYTTSFSSTPAKPVGFILVVSALSYCYTHGLAQRVFKKMRRLARFSSAAKSGK